MRMHVRSLTALAAATALTAGAFGMSAAANAAPAASAARHAKHGFGLNVAEAKSHRHVSSGHALPLRSVDAAAVPSSYSLESYALSPGDQGQVGACVAWATGYSAYGILMSEQGISGAPMAPMYIYSQIAQGDDEGTTASVALPMEEDQGIDTASDYTQGNYDYTTQPTDAERANAANYKLSGFEDLDSGNIKSNVEQAIASGLPVVIGFQARESFEDLDSSDYNYDPSTSDSVIGGHEVTIVGYDSTGVTIENSWGTSWGDGGYFTAPWSFITGSDIMEIHSVGMLVTS